MPAMRETGVRFLGREDPLEKEMAIHSSTIAWKIPWTEEPGRLQSMRSQRVRHDFTFTFTTHIRASLIAQLVKNPPSMPETLVPFLGGEDPLEKGKATHSSILDWRIPRTEEPGRLQSMGSQRVGHD